MVIVIHRVTDCERIAIYKFDFSISGVSLSQSASTFCFQTGNSRFPFQRRTPHWQNIYIIKNPLFF